MKQLICAVVVLTAVLSWGQGSSYTGITAVKGAGNLQRVIPNAPIVVCSYPATGGTPCTNYATTYTSPTLGTSCSVSPLTQVVAPATSTCIGTSDSQGNFEIFAGSGNYAYYFQNNNSWYGPYVVTLGGAATGGGTVTQVNAGTGISITGAPTSVPVVNIATNPTIPGNPTILGRTWTGINGNTGTLQASGSVSGTAAACFDSSGNITNVGCPPVTALAAGSAAEVQFRNSLTGGMAADSLFNYNPTSHTLSAQNIYFGSTFSGGTPFAISAALPSVTCSPTSFNPTLTLGMTGLCVDSNGQLAVCPNGGPCQDVPLAGGQIVSLSPPVGTAQHVVQNVAAVGSATVPLDSNNFANVRYVTPSWNWQQSPADSLAAASTTFTITTTSESGSTATYNTSGVCTFTTGAAITIRGNSIKGYNQNAVVLAPGCNGGSSFTATLFTTGLAAGAGGTAYLGQTVTLTPCPVGVNTASSSPYPFYVYISTTGTAEAADVVGGTCTSGATTGTLSVVTVNPHSAGYTVSSAYQGIQEAYNDAQPADNTNQNYPVAALEANTSYSVYAPIYIHGRGGRIEGKGAVLNCFTRYKCMEPGDESASNRGYQKISDVNFVPQLEIDGAQITSVTSSSGDHTVTTATAHNLLAGDIAHISLYNASETFIGFYTVTSVVDSTHFHFTNGALTYGATNTFGNAVIENAAIEDNGAHVVIERTEIYQVGGVNHFSFGIVDDNDQALVIDKYSNRAASAVRCGANFCGYQIFSRGDGVNAGIVYLANSELSLQCGGNGVYLGSGNSSSITNTVIQGFSQVGVWAQNGLQGSSASDMYEEIGGCSNPYYPGSLQAEAGLIVQGQKFENHSPAPVIGQIPAFGSGSGSQRNIYIQPHNSVQGWGPVILAGYSVQTSGTVNYYWPMLPSADKYALYLTTGVLGQSQNAPAPGTNNATGIACDSGCSNSSVLQSSCSKWVCTFADALPDAGSSVTLNSQAWGPVVAFWPGSVVLGNSADNSSVGNVAKYVASTILTTNISGIVSMAGGVAPTVFLNYCSGFSAWSATEIECLGADPLQGPGSIATVLGSTDAGNNGATAQSKGRLNFALNQNYPNDIITYRDSNFAKTVTAPGLRTLNDAGDVARGLDNSGNGIYDRAPTSFSRYLNKKADDSTYAERLTSSAETYNVPVTLSGSNGLTVGGITTLNGASNTIAGTTTHNGTVQINAAATVAGALNAANDTGTGAAYVVTLAPAIGSVHAYQFVAFLPKNANTSTTATLNVNGTGALTITKNGQQALSTNPPDLTTTAIAYVMNDGSTACGGSSCWQLLNPQSNFQGGISWPISFTSGGSTFSNTAAVFVGTAHTNSSEGTEQWPVPRAGTLTALYCNYSASLTGSMTLQMTVRQNAGSGALTCTMNSGSPHSCSDTAAGHAIIVAAGDLIDLTTAVTNTPTQAALNCSVLMQ